MNDNRIMLITYPDSLGNNLKDLKDILDTYFRDAVGGVHILPFFPSSGDRGFAPIDYRKVDPAFGTWEDINRIGQDYYLMFDYMINHISAHSPYYQDFLTYKDESAWKDLFIRYKDFWKDGEPTPEEVKCIYKRKPRAPYTTAHFADGTSEKVWCTFDEEQIDVNCKSSAGKNFIRDNLRLMTSHGAKLIRLDAFAYTTKRAGTNCFFVEPDVWEFMDECKNDIEGTGAELLPEIHEHYSMQLKLAEHGYKVYDFALPMLVLNAIYYGSTQYLKQWLSVCPRDEYTTLDTHDGIGVVDVVDLMPEDEILRTKDDIFRYGANVKKVYNTVAYNNLDIYQVNCTYYSALGDDDAAYLLARVLQFFAPGVPMVYYVGLLAGKNDLKLLEETKVGRNINRHYYSKAEIAEEVKRPVVRSLLNMMEFRNETPAFRGDFMLEDCNDHSIIIHRKYSDAESTDEAVLRADFKDRTFTVTHNGEKVHF